MRQLKLLGLAVISILAFTFVASTAQAVELRQLPSGLKFSFKSIGVTKLQTLSGKVVECLAVTGKGEGKVPPLPELNSERLGLIEFTFTDCKGPLGVKCTGLSGEPEGTIVVKGEYHIRHLLSPNEAFVNLAILVPAAHFSCLNILFVVKGCVASMDLLTKEAGANAVNLLLETIFTEFLNENPTTIDTDNSLGMEECVLKSKEGNAAEETAGQIGKGTLESCLTEAGAKCTFLIDLSGMQ